MAGTNTKKRTRCPNGTRRNPKTGNCEPKKAKSGVNTKHLEVNTNANANLTKNTKKRSRCSNGMRKNPKTGKCEATKNISKKVYKYKVKAKPRPKERKQKKAMQNELMELSRPYQAHKKAQIEKKRLAKLIKANNLQRTKAELKGGVVPDPDEGNYMSHKEYFSQPEKSANELDSYEKHLKDLKEQFQGLSKQIEQDLIAYLSSSEETGTVTDDTHQRVFQILSGQLVSKKTPKQIDVATSVLYYKNQKPDGIFHLLAKPKKIGRRHYHGYMFVWNNTIVLYQVGEQFRLNYMVGIKESVAISSPIGCFADDDKKGFVDAKEVLSKFYLAKLKDLSVDEFTDVITNMAERIGSDYDTITNGIISTWNGSVVTAFL
jgi:hypothetical protein